MQIQENVINLIAELAVREEHSSQTKNFMRSGGTFNVTYTNYKRGSSSNANTGTYNGFRVALYIK